ncbi:MAG: hypothetical protein Q4G67_08810 [Actinomycetia bacterium]|nr:hypothetical protein [Actinomycetes bacterium]
MSAIPDEVAGLARRQAGVLCRRQLTEHLSDEAIEWRLASGRWQRIMPGVYATHAGEVTWEMRAHAAVLYCGKDAVLALDAAGYLHGFITRQPQVITVAVPHSRKVRRVPGLKVVRRRQLQSATRKGFAVTTAVESVLDCAASPLFTERDVICLVADAVRARAATEDDLAAGLAGRARHPHRRVIALAIGDVAEGAESGLEILALRDVIRAHGLPEMTMQQPVDGGRLRRDFENEEYRVVLELDGRVGHEGSDRLRDLRRDRQASSSGRITLRAGWVDAATDPCELAWDLFGTYRSRGYRGALLSCGLSCSAGRAAAAG